MFLVNNQGTKGITVLAQRRQKKSNRKTNVSKPSADFVNARKLP